MRIVMIHGSALFQNTIVNLLLQQPGFEVIGRANTNTKGVKLATMLKPDLVLVDFNSAVPEGAAVIRELKSHAQPPRIIMLSQNNEPSNRIFALSVGADGYVEATDIQRELIPLVRRVAGLS